MAPSERGLLTRLGVVTTSVYALHAAWHVAHGSSWDLLWVCNVAFLALAGGCLFARPAVIAGAWMALLFGTPLWVLDACASSLVPTSVLTHVGGDLLGLWLVRKVGCPRGTWARASAAVLGLLALTALVSPPEANVNLAFRVYTGWERIAPSHRVYLAALWSLATAVFFALERWVTLPPRAPGARPG